VSDDQNKLCKSILDAISKASNPATSYGSLLIPPPSPKPDLFSILAGTRPPQNSNLLSALLGNAEAAKATLTKKAMALRDQLIEEASKIFRERWDTRQGEVVPEAATLQLGNDGVILNATIMYADMRSSTAMVSDLSAKLAAEIYKAYLSCAARVIKANGGTITAYDGDRIMAVFIGGRKNTSAAQSALKINWALQNILNPALKKQYGDSVYQLAHVIGVDTSEVLVSRIGVRNDNDLVWVGRAANYAAKLAALDGDFNAWITAAVFENMLDEAKYGGNPRRLMWEARRWTQMSDMRVHGSNWTWSL